MATPATMTHETSVLPAIGLDSIFRAYFPFLVEATSASPDPNDLDRETRSKDSE